MAFHLDDRGVVAELEPVCVLCQSRPGIVAQIGLVVVEVHVVETPLQLADAGRAKQLGGRRRRWRRRWRRWRRRWRWRWRLFHWWRGAAVVVPFRIRPTLKST